LDYADWVRRTSFAEMHCSLARSLEVVGDWWNPLILRDLYLGVNRFDDLAVDLGLSRNLLAARLASLVASGLVERRPYQDHPARYDYVLGPAGEDLAPILMALTAWGDRWVPPEAGPPLVFEHRACGASFVPGVACSSCGEQISARDVAVRPGPGGRAARGTALVAGRVAAHTRRRPVAIARP
jgi:DNA-binding HxlR family transcriptional regulator